MEKNRETRDPDIKSGRGSSRESMPLVKKSQIPHNAERSAEEVRQSPAQSSPANAPVPARTATQAASEESQAAWPLFALIVLIVIASAGAILWIRTRKRAEAHIRHLETAAEIPSTCSEFPTDRPQPSGSSIYRGAATAGRVAECRIRGKQPPGCWTGNP